MISHQTEFVERNSIMRRSFDEYGSENEVEALELIRTNFSSYFYGQKKTST